MFIRISDVRFMDYYHYETWPLAIYVGEMSSIEHRSPRSDIIKCWRSINSDLCIFTTFSPLGFILYVLLFISLITLQNIYSQFVTLGVPTPKS